MQFRISPPAAKEWLNESLSASSFIAKLSLLNLITQLKLICSVLYKKRLVLEKSAGKREDVQQWTISSVQVNLKASTLEGWGSSFCLIPIHSHSCLVLNPDNSVPRTVHTKMLGESNCIPLHYRAILFFIPKRISKRKL